MKRVVSMIIAAMIAMVIIMGCASDSATSGISELIWSFPDREIGMNIRDSKSGYILVSVQDRSNFDTGDITFISDDESVATIKCTRTALTVYLYFEIVAVGAGTTSVYAASSDGATISEKIEINVIGGTATEAVTEAVTDIHTDTDTGSATAPQETKPVQTDAPATYPPRVEPTNTDPPSEVAIESAPSDNPVSGTYVLNTSTKKIHKMSCASVKRIKPENYATTTDYDAAIADGYVQCKKCG